MSKETDKQDKADAKEEKVALAKAETKEQNEYPRWAHHPTGAEESKVVNSPDEWPDGWSDLPATEEEKKKAADAKK